MKINIQPRELKERTRLLLSHSMVQTAWALYGVQFASYVLPLVLIPFLTRVLQPSGWGLVAFGQSFANYYALVVDFGFSLAGTRAVARSQGNPEERAQLLAGVTGAKIVIFVACLVIAITLVPLMGPFAQHPRLFRASLCFAFTQSFAYLWYFQGIERLPLVSSIGIICRGSAIGAIVLVVKHPGQEWLVLSLQAAGAGLSTIISGVLAYKTARFVWPHFVNTRKALKVGARMFLASSAVNLYTVGNVFILGLVAPASEVGFYSAAEKIVKALVNLLWPISQAIFPRVSNIIAHSRKDAARLVALGLLVTGSIAVVMTVGIITENREIVTVILGSKYLPVIPILIIQAFLPPVIAASNCLGVQWMLPLGLDRAFNIIIVMAGMLNIILGVALSKLFAGGGMACAVLCTETVIPLAMYLYLHWKKLDPFTFLGVETISASY